MYAQLALHRGHRLGDIHLVVGALLAAAGQQHVFHVAGEQLPKTGSDSGKVALGKARGGDDLGQEVAAVQQLHFRVELLFADVLPRRGPRRFFARDGIQPLLLHQQLHFTFIARRTQQDERRDHQKNGEERAHRQPRVALTDCQHFGKRQGRCRVCRLRAGTDVEAQSLVVVNLVVHVSFRFGLVATYGSRLSTQSDEMAEVTVCSDRLLRRLGMKTMSPGCTRRSAFRSACFSIRFRSTLVAL